MPANIPLGDAEVERFIADGYVRIDNAFSSDVAAEARKILWAVTGCSADNPATWIQPVIRLGQFVEPPFREAANTLVLHTAFDRLVGKGRWHPRLALGTFPVRFPSEKDPGDGGWHIDVSFGLPTDDASDFFSWRANVRSRDRALLMLFLFSDVGEHDAPTRIRVGSHVDVARRLAPAGEDGLTLRELAATGFEESAHRPEALATGPAGTVYLCHPFLVHAAQMHRGTTPKFMAQPPLSPAVDMSIDQADGNYSAVEIAIRRALN